MGHGCSGCALAAGAAARPGNVEQPHGHVPALRHGDRHQHVPEQLGGMYTGFQVYSCGLVESQHMPHQLQAIKETHNTFKPQIMGKHPHPLQQHHSDHLHEQDGWLEPVPESSVVQNLCIHTHMWSPPHCASPPQYHEHAGQQSQQATSPT